MRLSLSVKFYLTLLPLFITGLLVAWLTYTGLQSNAQELVAARRVKELAVNSLALLLTQDDASKGLLMDMGTDTALRKIEAYDTAQKTFEQMQQMTRVPEMLALIEELKRMDEKELRPLDTRVLETIGGTNADAAKKIYFTEYEPVRAKYETALRRLVDAAEKAAQVAAQDMTAKNQRSFSKICSALVVGLAIVMLIMIMVTRHVARQLNVTISLLRQEAETTGAASMGLNVASRNLSEGACSIASSLQQTSASLEEMSGVLKINANTAQSAKDLAAQTRAAAETGASDMREMTGAMAEIKSASDKISKIIKTIDEIAFQTNLLALNAAVEAARAGETGMGFAVVADEVRNLARRSAEAAKETAAKIEDSMEKSDRGVQISAKVGASLEAIFTKACGVDELVGRIAETTQQQSVAVSQVNTAVTQIDTITQKNAAGAEEGARAAEELSNQAHSLETAIADLVSLVTGRPAKAHMASVAAPENEVNASSHDVVPMKDGARAIVSPLAETGGRSHARFHGEFAEFQKS
jgi:methyl-accepting chemotaxis protein